MIFIAKIGLLWGLFTIFPLFAIAQDMRKVRQTIDTLASWSMLGRGYVKQGDKIAAQFIAQEFEKLGLKKFNYRDTYFQHFAFDVNTFPEKIKLKIGRKRLQVGQDFIVNAISKKGKGSGKIVILDSLLWSKDSLYQTFLKQKLEKKILVYEAKNYKKIVQDAHLVAKLHQAKALIELQEKKLTASVSNKQLSQPILEMLNKDFDRNAKKARFRVDALWLKNYVSQNVIGYVEGSTEPDNFLVITAHYDHLGTMGKKACFRGAHDNASGVSMLLALADYYAKPQNKPRCSVVFMAFGGEEMGLLGSKFYTENPFFSLKKIKFLLNLDMVSTGEDGIMAVNGAVFEQEFQLLQRLNEQKKYFKVVQKRGLAANSDHYFFTENGVKSFYIYTLGTSLKAYHDVYDVPQNLPLSKYSELFNLITDFFRELSP